MALPDARIYAAHAIFWLAFAAGDIAARARRRRSPGTPAPGPAPPPDVPLRAPRSGVLVAVHMGAFALMYSGIGQAVFGRKMPMVSPMLPVAGALLILAGGVLGAWARLAFASWRFRAQLDPGHQLATGGPFRWVRHPIYTALDLLAIGTALWIPTTLTLLGMLAMVAGSELRARAEEPLLERAFGEEYREYRRRTRRFVPGVY